MNRRHACSTSRIAIATLALAALGACATGPATPSSARATEIQFSSMDADDDGALQLDEIGNDLRLYREFGRYDVDGTGGIELDEFYEYINDSE